MEPEEIRSTLTPSPDPVFQEKVMDLLFKECLHDPILYQLLYIMYEREIPLVNILFAGIQAKHEESKLCRTKLLEQFMINLPHNIIINEDELI